MIKLILLDIDGVMTDGRKYYDKEGTVRLKTFCDKDWTAIKRFRALGIQVAFLSGDGFNANIANKCTPKIDAPCAACRARRPGVTPWMRVQMREKLGRARSTRVVQQR